MKIVLHQVFFLIFNLFSVYFFEYSIISCFADRIAIKVQDNAPEDKKKDFQVKSLYVLLNTCYQIGVFISRSSLQYVKIKKIWMVSFFQAINFTFLFFNTKYLFVDSIYFLCPLLIWVGLMGGAAYVNVMH